MNRIEIAAALREIGHLLKLKSNEEFRARAYIRASQALAESGGDFAAMVEQNRLTRIKGIGDSLAQLIKEMYTTGGSSLLEELRKEFPSDGLALMEVPGITQKKAQALHTALGVSTVEQLKSALDRGDVARVAGFGEKTQDALRSQIANYERSKNRILLLQALQIAEQAADYVRQSPDAIDVDIAGSVRRWKETIGTVRLTASSEKPANLIRHFLEFPPAASVIHRSLTSARIQLIDGAEVLLTVSAPSNYARLLLNETGSASHLEKLRKIEKSGKARSTVRKAATRPGKANRLETEAEIYGSLGMQYIPPELREGNDEIDLAQAGLIPDDLITIKDIKGMTHCHSLYSDGRNSIKEMALAAQAMGMKYMTITDHSPTAHYAGGLQLDRLKRQWDEIEKVQEQVKIKLLRGTESDILRDGSLDYPDNVLEQFDIIIASVHSRYQLDESQMTERLITAMRNPLFKVWGHPLGRLVQRRPPISCRMEDVLDVIAESNAVVEISADPHRLDLEPHWIREARKRSIRFVISTDAHSISDLLNLKFGIGNARRGGVRRGEVLNTLPYRSFKAAISSST